MTDYQTLIDSCKAGDAKSQRILYDLFKARLMGLCRRYSRNREEAQDILQESFIRIFNRIGQVTSSGKLESWMKAVAVRTAINHYHKYRVQGQLFLSVKEEDLAFHGPSQPAHFSDNYLVKVVNELPDGCRMVFNLFCVEGYSHTEIAGMLQISEGTSRSQLHHAKFLLKAKLRCQNLEHYYEKFA